MVIINYDGTTYYGRLISIQAIEQELVGTDNKKVIKNVGYDVVIMDSFGAVIYLMIEDLNCIIWS